MGGGSFFFIQDLLYANALYRAPPPDEKYIYSSDYFSGKLIQSNRHEYNEVYYKFNNAK
jgi:hypothetical protein